MKWSNSLNDTIYQNSHRKSLNKAVSSKETDSSDLSKQKALDTDGYICELNKILNNNSPPPFETEGEILAYFEKSITPIYLIRQR